MSMLKKTAEKQVADEVLQAPFTVKVGDKTYEVARPTLATLILASSYVSQIKVPVLANTDQANIKEALSIAKDSAFIGELVAILILGSKGVNPRRMRFPWQKTGANRQKELAAFLLDEMNPKELFDLAIKLLERMEVGFFLSTIIFLQEVNLLRTTR